MYNCPNMKKLHGFVFAKKSHYCVAYFLVNILIFISISCLFIRMGRRTEANFLVPDRG